jgi:hydrogenase expression/formation protein
MLDALEIDYLGVSLDALLVVAPPDVADEIIEIVRSVGIRMARIGFVEEGAAEPVLRTAEGDTDFIPRFREAAYTPVKKVVDTQMRDFDVMKEAVEAAADRALAKKERVLEYLQQNNINE